MDRFVSLADLTADELRTLLRSAIELKKERKAG